MSEPNQAWVSDLTYIWTDEGWLYLAGIKDLFSGELVGYAMDERMTRTLVMQAALFGAVALKRPAQGLILHSDRGSQYCSHDYLALARQFGMKMSMSRKGDCYDNAPMESFWGSLKNELVHHERFATRQQARNAITEFLQPAAQTGSSRLPVSRRLYAAVLQKSTRCLTRWPPQLTTDLSPLSVKKSGVTWSVQGARRLQCSIRGKHRPLNPDTQGAPMQRPGKKRAFASAVSRHSTA